MVLLLWEKFKNLCLKAISNLFICIISVGVMPRHVGFLCDGSRRFGEKYNIHTYDGQNLGFFMDSTKENLIEPRAKQLRDILKKSPFKTTILYCSQLKIKELTMFIVHINNMQRCKEEVDHFLLLLVEILEDFLNNRELYKKLGIRLCVLGITELMPEYLQKMVAEAVFQTKDNDKMILNLLLCYTSNHEVTDSVKSIVNGVKSNEITVDDITGELISKCVYGPDSPPLDMIIRTSGVSRLSNFCLWQSFSAEMVYFDIFWPEFNIWYLAKALFRYQRKAAAQEELKSDRLDLIKQEQNLLKSSSKLNTFIANVANERFENLMKKRNLDIPVVC